MQVVCHRFCVVLVTAICTLSLSIPPVHAELIAFAEFRDGGDGTIDGDISGEGWGDGWTVENADLGGTSVPVDWAIDVPDYGTITATTAVQFGGSPLGSGIQRELAEVQSGDDIYISFLTKWESGVVNGNDFVIWYFGANGGPNIGYKANEGSGDDGLDFVARTSGSTNQYSADLEVGELNFVVGHLSKSISGESELYDTYELWVNPSFNDSANPQAVSEGPSNISEFSAVGVRSHQINPDGEQPDDLRFANLRIASSWESVFPPGGALPDPGDFNEDGAVDFADFLVLSMNIYGHLDGVSGFDKGDMNRDGRIDLADFHDFVEVFNGTAQAAAQSVPEPSAIYMLIVPLIGLLRWTRYSRRA